MKNQLIEIDYYSIGDYNFCAKIYHKGLDEKQEKRCFNKSQLESEVERSIKRLNLKWELLQFIQLEKFLIDGLVIFREIKFEEFKRNDKFEEPHPENVYKSKFDELKYPDKLELKQLTERPVKEELKDKPQKNYFTPSYSLFDLIFGKEKKRMISKQWFNDCLQDWTIESEKANNHYQETLKQWEIECNLIENENKKIQDDYEKSLIDYESKKKSLAKQRNDAISCWNQQKTEFFQLQEKYNRQLNEVKRSYSNLELSVVAEYSVLILENSKYPSFIKKKFEVDYNPENKILVVEYALPPIDAIPTLKDVKLVKGEWKEYYISDAQAMKNFENTLYSIALRTLYELFQTDEINAIDAICFNGWVNAINKATGKRENNCILSVQVKKEEFQEIDLSLVDPKTCFKSLKGVSSSKLSSITSIQPIIQINRKDKRFVDSHNVTANIDDSTNLAAMDWEEFEHLIREIFEKEFSSNGGEVKVTQASRDGGVDAVAFDPDPIRGGKIVIQAKRYTNTVGVSAVRDLYGTVLNEGATKGILVTTSDYGSDSYEFAKGKPLTLLNGSNLLYLLEKHGHKAKIDIEEARRLMKELWKGDNLRPI